MQCDNCGDLSSLNLGFMEHKKGGCVPTDVSLSALEMAVSVPWHTLSASDTGKVISWRSLGQKGMRALCVSHGYMWCHILLWSDKYNRRRTNQKKAPYLLWVLPCFLSCFIPFSAESILFVYRNKDSESRWTMEFERGSIFQRKQWESMSEQDITCPVLKKLNGWLTLQACSPTSSLSFILGW